MGISNGRAHLERRISNYLAELEERRLAAKRATEAASQLPDIKVRITHLEALVQAVELLLREDDPTWNCSRAKPMRKHSFKSPFPIGEAGRMALEVLRGADAPMTAREIVRVMLDRIGIVDYERPLLDKQTNSLNAYLAKHRDDLVESDGEWPQKWQVIR